MTVSKTETGKVWAAGGRRAGLPVAGVQPGRGGAGCDFTPRSSKASQIGEFAKSVGGVKALADMLGMNRGTLKHIIDGQLPVPLALWQSLTGADAMREALAGLLKRRIK